VKRPGWPSAIPSNEINRQPISFPANCSVMNLQTHHAAFPPRACAFHYLDECLESCMARGQPLDISSRVDSRHNEIDVRGTAVLCTKRNQFKNITAIAAIQNDVTRHDPLPACLLAMRAWRAIIHVPRGVPRFKSRRRAKSHQCLRRSETSRVDQIGYNLLCIQFDRTPNGCASKPYQH
jgi:hypothetical protein